MSERPQFLEFRVYCGKSLTDDSVRPLDIPVETTVLNLLHRNHPAAWEAVIFLCERRRLYEAKADTAN